MSTRIIIGLIGNPKHLIIGWRHPVPVTLPSKPTTIRGIILYFSISLNFSRRIKKYIVTKFTQIFDRYLRMVPPLINCMIFDSFFMKSLDLKDFGDVCFTSRFIFLLLYTQVKFTYYQ